MYTITEGQLVQDMEGYEVVSPTGEYQPFDLILVRQIGTIEPTMQFEAKFVVLGNEAYNFKNKK